MEEERDTSHRQGEDLVRQPSAELIHVNNLRQRENDDRHRLEDTLSIGGAQLRALVKLIPVGVYLTDAQGRCQYANDRWLKMAGLTLEEALGDGWVNGLYAEDRERIAAAWVQTIEAEGYWAMDYRFQTSVDRVTWVLGTASPLWDDQGRVTGFIGAALDITHLKRAEEQLKAYSSSLEDNIEVRTHELEVAQAQLIRREKLAALGQLAGSVGHELRNPLSVIYNAAYFLQMMLDGADEMTKEYLDLIATTAREAEAIVTDLLDFSRTRAAERGPVPVESLLDSALVKRPVPEHVRLALDIAPDLPLMWVDARQIGQVLDNLITNAYQAMTDGGTLTLTARAEYDRVHLEVTDTGCGITSDDQAHIFEPLFTTKTRGIGLGLALSKNYVELNEGTIGFESVPGAGCTFTLSLPVRQTRPL